MHFRKTISLLVIFLLMMSIPAFSKQGKNNVSGKVKVSGDDASVWIDFTAAGAKNSRAIGGSFCCQPDGEGKKTCANVVYMKVDGRYAWLAGKCTSDSSGLAGRWFFMAVHDGGTPGYLADHLWLDWLPDTPDAESVAKRKVENLEKPANNKSIEAGNIVVEPCK